MKDKKVKKDRKDEEENETIPYNIDAEMETGRLLNMMAYNSPNMSRIKSAQSILADIRCMP